MESLNKISLVEVRVGALIIDPNSNSPIVVLKGVENDAILPIWVGGFEANAIAWEIEKLAPQRPMTHDLLHNFIKQMKCVVTSVIITELLDNTFYAVLEIRDRLNKVVNIDARPSDAIALALRCDSPIFVVEDVLQISSSASTARIVSDEKENIETNSEDEWSDWIG